MLDAIYSETKDHMQRCVENLQKQLAAIRTGKATPALLEGITVEAYGTKMPLNQVATLAAPEPRLLTLAPFDASQIANIEKAIQASNLGITPTNDGTIIRLPIPPLTEERRKELVKRARSEAEDAKVGIRNGRKEMMDEIKQLGKDGLSEDSVKDAEGEAQTITDRYVQKVEGILSKKEEEIMAI